MMALPLRVLRYKSVMQSETRSMRAIWSRVKAGQGRHELLEAPNLDACFEQVQNKRRGVALWESDNDAGQSLWEHEGNYLSVLRTNQKRMEATLDPRIFPRDRNVQQLYAHCALNTSFYPFHCAIIALPLSRDRNVQQLYAHCALNRCFYPFHCTCHYRASTTLRGLICAHPTSTLRCHWDCGAHDSFQGVVPMLSIASQCIHVTISLPLDLFDPVTLFSSERRPAALVLSILKGASGFCA